MGGGGELRTLVVIIPHHMIVQGYYVFLLASACPFNNSHEMHFSIILQRKGTKPFRLKKGILSGAYRNVSEYSFVFDSGGNVYTDKIYICTCICVQTVIVFKAIKPYL